MHRSDGDDNGIDTPFTGLGGHVRVGMSSRSGANLLTVDGEGLALKCLRTYRFAAHEVVAIERDGPAGLSAGVRIVHCRPDYPREMHFRCLGGVEAVTSFLARRGFFPSGSNPAGRPGLLPAARWLFWVVGLLVVASAVIQLVR